MINYKDIEAHKTAVVFEFDNVLVPKKDYDLQVYYLFANFIEYLETFPPPQEMLDFISKRYEVHGNLNMFEEVVNAFGIDKKYKENLDLLFTNANLPLKLLLYKEALELLQELVINRKQIFILTTGKPEQQLNKIKQTEWNGLEQYLKLYFTDEFSQTSTTPALDYLLEENNLQIDNVLVVSKQ
ncbi:hypothetical protein [Pedobacter alpinus]|uniref:Haloacid dehalogenase n=1 Tax=Pedobacter alpinus TaxID=1590643 RepID=A0ABW5TUF4_9SPHI